MDNIQDITQGIQEMKFEVIARSLPEEIIQHILIRLPVKSLIKCTSVCKTWRSMIINQSFIRAHLSTTVDFANQNDVDLLLLHRISGSSSRNNYQNTFILPTQGVKDDASIGFGFDATTNDYKVMRVVTLLYEDETPTLAEVYSLATGTWRSLGCVSPACLIDKAASTAFVNGVLHWPVVCQTDVDSYYFILTFDLGKEVFSQIPMPKIIQWNFELGLQLSVSDNRKSIALFMRPNNRFILDYRPEDSVLDIWVMKEYDREESWTKLNTLCPQGPETIFPSALCFRKSGEVLLLLKEEERQELVSLDLVSKQFKILGISGYKYCTGHFYKESLL